MESYEKDRLILIFKHVFKKNGMDIPIEQCDDCNEVLYCDSDIWVSDDNTKIFCLSCMGKEVDRRK